MTTKQEFAAYMAATDARTLEDAVRIIKRRRVIVPGISRNALCRVLTTEADSLRRSEQGYKEGS